MIFSNDLSFIQKQTPIVTLKNGDVIKSYNDVPPEEGKPPLGPFYELETSSPAAALKPGETIKHVQRTFHIQGPEELLEPLATKLLGVGLEEIKRAF